MGIILIVAVVIVIGVIAAKKYTEKTKKQAEHDALIYKLKQQHKVDDKQNSQLNNGYSSYSRSETTPSGIPFIDTQNLSENYSAEERNRILKIARHYGKRYITQQDMIEFTIDEIGDLFSSMPGWDIWDYSVHHASGQYRRMERAALDEIPVLIYDPKYKIAKVQGHSDCYLVNHDHCSCPDFRKRHLPCKHMCALAMELDGDITKSINKEAFGCFCGLKFALAGRFPGGRNSPTGIRAKINERGGMWSDDITFDCSALIIGDSPSETKINLAKNLNMEILTMDAVETFLSFKSEDTEASETEIPQIMQ